MKYQTNPELGPFLNRWGCHFCCILQKVEKRGGVKFTNPEVVEVYELCMANWSVQKEEKGSDGSPIDGCSVLNGKTVFNTAAQFKGLKIRCKIYSHVPVYVLPGNNEEEILELTRDAKPGVHFVSGSGKPDSVKWQGEIEFDPIEGGSQTAKLGKIKSKRILTF